MASLAALVVVQVWRGLQTRVTELDYSRFQIDELDALGQSLGPRRAYADTTAERIDAAVRARLQGALDRAKAILEANRAVLDDGAARLLEDETLEGEALDKVLARAERPDRLAA